MRTLFAAFLKRGFTVALGCLWVGGLVSCSTGTKKPSESPIERKMKAPTVERQASTYDELIMAAKQKKDRKLYSLVEDRLVKNEKDKITLNALAMYHYQRGRYDLAEFILRLNLGNFPEDVALYNNMALVQSAKGDQVAAFYWLRKGLRLNSRHPILRMHLASLCVEVRNYKMAYQLFERLEREGKLKGTRVLSHYAMALVESGKAEKAKRVYESMMENSRKAPPGAYLNYSYLLLKHFQYPERALTVLKKISVERLNSQLQKKYRKLYNEAMKALTGRS